ncbi:putative Zinc finger, RING-type [Plasmopara halstedii]
MNEDEDMYGFGSFSDLFDTGPTKIAKRLDLNGLSRICMSERKVVCFQQQQQQNKSCVVYEHVAAKFNGVSIDGGLGALSVVPLEEGGGFVWIQTTMSDSNARGRRKKELQDITNHHRSGGDHKAADALCVPIKCVISMQTTTLQNRAKGVEIELVDGDCLEFTFLPGPFAKLTHRDKFLQALKQQTRDKMETQTIISDLCDQPCAKKRKRESKVETEGTHREKIRQLVRRYTELDPMSAEAFAIVNEVHTRTGYFLGPTAKEMPKFSENSEFRKKSMENLADYFRRIKQEGKEADAHREMHMKVKYLRTKNNKFEYTDIDTGTQISPQTYEQRYFEYLKIHETISAIHELPIRDKIKCSLMETSLVATEAESARSVFMVTLGMDISKSRVIDSDFFSLDIDNAPTGTQTCNRNVAAFRDAVNTVRTRVWNCWGMAFAQASDMCTSSTRSTSSLPDQATLRKRHRGRRQSLMVPKFDDLHATIEKNLAESSQGEQCAVASASSGPSSPKARTKRVQDITRRQDSVKKTYRASSAQKRVHLLQNGTEEKTTAAQHKTSQTSGNLMQSKHLTRKTSPLEMVDDDDLSLCQLCYSDEALVQMKPCDHKVCSSCWSRLSPSSGKNGTGLRRFCPWDREVVSKQSQ